MITLAFISILIYAVIFYAVITLAIISITVLTSLKYWFGAYISLLHNSEIH